MSSSGILKYENISNDEKNQLLPEPLLVLLNEKNESIEKLKNQIHNQKNQLEFYLKKQLNLPQILDLSQTCSPKVITESIPLTLAVNKFYKDIGVEDELKLLHNDMSKINKRATLLLKIQECILREIIRKICDLFKYKSTDAKFLFQLKNTGTDMYHMQLFNTLLSATCSLRRELTSYGICCDRLLVLQDERNSLVEEIYSLPSEYRMNCDYLIGNQMKRFLIENGTQQKTETSEKLEWKISDLYIKDNNYKNELEGINAEAKQLLAISQIHKEKYVKEITELKEENKILHAKLRELKNFIENKNENHFSNENITLKNEIDNKERVLEYQLEKKTKECEMLKQHLEIILEEIEKQKIKTEKGKLDKMKDQNFSTVEPIHKELKKYKNQITDILLDKIGQTPIEIEYLKKHIKELKKENDLLKKKTKHAKETNWSLSRQILQLLEIVENSTRLPGRENNYVNSLIEVFSKTNKDLLNKSKAQVKSVGETSKNNADIKDIKNINYNNEDIKNKFPHSLNGILEKNKIREKINPKSITNKRDKMKIINVGNNFDTEQSDKTDTIDSSGAATPSSQPTKVEFKRKINQRNNKLKESKSGIKKESKRNQKQSHAWVKILTDEVDQNSFNKIYTN